MLKFVFPLISLDLRVRHESSIHRTNVAVGENGWFQSKIKRSEVHYRGNCEVNLAFPLTQKFKLLNQQNKASEQSTGNSD
jgi:hypothetical protein